MSDNPPIKHLSWLTSGDFTAADDPFALFTAWMSDATASEPRDANAMAVATVDADGLPDVRMVLLKGLDERGFVFYTNLESQKGRQLAGQPKAALVFHWKSLNRQVRARGAVERVSDAEADAYFATRPRGAQVGAWASRQSTPLASRAVLEEEVAKFERHYDVAEVPRPPHWSGFRLLPRTMEFWHDRPFRLHDRVVFERKRDGWEKTRLYP